MNAAQITRQIKELLRLRHPGPEWAGFDELRSGTGAPQELRYLDFFTLNLWPSKDHRRIAYEIKATRADFMNEIDHPKKRQFAWDIANECYFACPINLIAADEVPEGWGLVEITRGGIRRKKAAKQHEVSDMPVAFVAAIARRSVEKPPERTALFWGYAGQELTEEKLMEIAIANLDNRIWRERREAVDEYRQSDVMQRLKSLAKIIRHGVGYRYSTEPERFEEWLNAIKNKPVEIDYITRLSLVDARDAINKILGEKKEEGKK